MTQIAMLVSLITPEIAWIAIVFIIFVLSPLANAGAEYISAKAKPRRPTPEELESWAIERLIDAGAIAEETGMKKHEIVRMFSDIGR